MLVSLPSSSAIYQAPAWTPAIAAAAISPVHQIVAKAQPAVDQVEDQEQAGPEQHRLADRIAGDEIVEQAEPERGVGGPDFRRSSRQATSTISPRSGISGVAATKGSRASRIATIVEASGTKRLRRSRMRTSVCEPAMRFIARLPAAAAIAAPAGSADRSGARRAAGAAAGAGPATGGPAGGGAAWSSGAPAAG